jgi:hypothetical protein
VAISDPTITEEMLREAIAQARGFMRYRLLDMTTGQQHGPLFTTHGDAERFGQREHIITGQLFFLEAFDPYTRTYDGEFQQYPENSESPKNPEVKKAPDMSEEIPKHELLIKLMGKTTSENDHEALAFLRKANSLVRESGWTWEQILRGKIKVVEDPFKNLRDPSGGSRAAFYATTAPPPKPTFDQWTFDDGNVSGTVKPKPQPRPEPPKPPPPPPPSYEASTPLSRISNNFGGYCYQCGVRVQPQGGVVFEPHSHNSTAPAGFRLLCPLCNHKGIKVRDYAATKKQGKASSTASSGPAPSVNDL